MEDFLTHALPNILPESCTFQVHPFHDKSQMLQKLGSRLRAYAKWLPQEWRIVVLIDRDSNDCQQLKQNIESVAISAGLRSRSTAGTSDWQVASRVVIEELEAWYFGDWDAVRAAYPQARSTLPPRFRNPDAVAGGTWEVFEREMQKSGYFKGGLRKRDAAREIGQYINPDRNTSHSFQVFRDAIVKATTVTSRIVE